VAVSRVSVVIPVRNGEAYLGEAIASVRRQSHPPLEIVVIDDGSTDGTASLAERLGSDIRLIRRPHSGVTVSRNRGIQAARGDLIAFLDCDDVWADDKLALQIPILAAHPNIEIVLGHTRRMWAPAAGGADAAALRLTESELALHLGAALIRRSTFERLGLFDEALPTAEDWDWFMRARERGAVVVVHPHVTLLYRRHGGNMSNDEPATRTALVGLIRRSIARRRSDGRDAASLPALPTLDQYLRAEAGTCDGAADP
jgi:glycosyltransferase involved in cell wall biosynthesis